jgi:hypothetical protein
VDHYEPRDQVILYSLAAIIITVTVAVGAIKLGLIPGITP